MPLDHACWSEHLRKAIAPIVLVATIGAVGTGTAQANTPQPQASSVLTVHRASSIDDSHLTLKLENGSSFKEVKGEGFISYQGKDSALPATGKDKTGAQVDLHYAKAANGNISVAVVKKNTSNKTTPYDWKCAAGTGGGAGAGAIAGGAAGATIGSVVPVAGTALGWAIGTAIGGAASGAATGAANYC